MLNVVPPNDNVCDSIPRCAYFECACGVRERQMQNVTHVRQAAVAVRQQEYRASAMHPWRFANTANAELLHAASPFAWATWISN